MVTDNKLKKLSINSVNLPMDTVVELTSGLIASIQDKGLSYNDIAEKLDIRKINRSIVCLIRQKRWFPPDNERQVALIKGLLEMKNVPSIHSKRREKSMSEPDRVVNKEVENGNS